MKKHILLSVTTLTLLLLSIGGFSQTPSNGTVNLGILTSFEAFTGAGGVTNSGGTVTGDVGTNLGTIGGFDSPSYTDNTYNADSITTQARFDLLRLYIHLNDLFVDFPNAFDPAAFPAHSAVFGVGETLAPGVYAIGSAGSIGGALTLDGGGDPDAVFVIKMNGALTVNAGASVSLTNGAKSSNVFWMINGAISVAAGAEVKGTLFAKAGAVGLGADVILEGRMLSMAGAITMGIGSSATHSPLPSTIPIFCQADCTPAPAADILGVLSDFTLFTKFGNAGNTGISGISGTIGTNAGAITGYTGGIHIGTEEIANALVSQAEADLDAAYIALMDMIPTGTGSATYLNETIAPGVYDIPTAGALGGTIILDAAGDPDAIFVFRFAGAFNIAAATKMVLSNGASRCNVFWLGGAGVATGAVNIGASCEIVGTFMAHGGACNSGGGVFMSGRQLSTGGAVNTNNAVVYNNPECVTSTVVGGSNIVASISGSSDVSCFGGNNGSATASASGGVTPYSYSWSNGETGANAFALTAGTHTVTVTDGNLNQAQENVTISQPTLLVASASIAVAKCTSYTVPSGDETYTSSGVYMDTIPSASGCDSVLTISVAIDETPDVTTFTSRTMEQFRVNWEYLLPVTANDTNFRIRYWPQGSPAMFNDKTQSPSDFQKKITGLTANTWYDVKVGFACLDGSFIWGATESVKTKIQSCSTPSNTLQVVPLQSSMATATWQDQGADEYKIRLRPAGGAWTWSTTSSATKTFAGLSSHTLYQYQVKARCGAVWSKYSPISQLFTAVGTWGTRLANTTENDLLSVDIYPNPVASGQAITVNINQSLARVSVSILDMAGRTVYHNSHFNTQQILLDLNLSKGLYRLRMISDGQEFGRNLIIK